MSTPPPQDRVAAGRQRLAARARRAANLRRRVVAGTLASFALAWGVIAFNGPMGAPANTTTTASTRSATSATTAATPTATPDTSSSGQNSTSAPVTTSQS
jgi:hypothetical protein